MKFNIMYAMSLFWIAIGGLAMLKGLQLNPSLLFFLVATLFAFDAMDTANIKNLKKKIEYLENGRTRTRTNR